VDVFMVAAIWILVYYIRFRSGFFSTSKGIPLLGYHLTLVLPMVGLCMSVFLWMGLYKPKRIESLLKLFLLLTKAVIMSALLISAFFYYLRNAPYSRNLLVLFVVILFLGLFVSRLLTTEFLRYYRKKGYNLRYYAIIGTGTKAQQLVQDLEKMEWTGLKCSFLIDDPVHGPVEKIIELIQSGGIDEVYVAVSGEHPAKIQSILESLQSMGVTIRILPDWGNLISITNPSVVAIGSQLLFSAGDSPLSGFNIIFKELFDRICALILLCFLFIPMLIIAVWIRLTSKGYVLYRQTRIGLDQTEFQIYKFRTMRTDAEAENGPQWSKPDDPRCTGIGCFLRKTSIDELPQLINVLKGEMSLVGPRPERPCFVKVFSENYRRYMLRHKVKTGMTGWAQVNGLRGDTSLRKRLAYDLYYVKNWSLWFDLWILIQTPWCVIKGKNAY
jgi:exopolysaccharide biosynthesis polyprenyl glycosylphosphotransferase